MSGPNYEQYRRGYVRGFEAAKMPHGLVPDDLASIDWLLGQCSGTIIPDPDAFRGVLNSLRKKIEHAVLSAFEEKV